MMKEFAMMYDFIHQMCPLGSNKTAERGSTTDGERVADFNSQFRAGMEGVVRVEPHVILRVLRNMNIRSVWSTFVLTLCVQLYSSTAFAQLLLAPPLRIDGASLTAFSPEEVSVAIDLRDDHRIVVGSNLYSKYFSTDQGFSWNTDTISSSYGIWGDPVLVSDQYGTIYFVHLSGSPYDTTWLDRMVVQKSSDGGKTFNDGSYTGLRGFHDQDKPALTCDLTNSPYRGNLYLAWTEFDTYGSLNPSDSSRILFSYSTDQATSWSDPKVLSDINGNSIDNSLTVELTSIAVGPDGSVYICWMGPAGLVVKRSDNGGKTFTPEKHVWTPMPGWDYPIPGFIRCNSSPTLLCDNSNSANRGMLYLLFGDKRLKSSDVYITRSSDRGDSWTTPVRVSNDSSGRERFFPTATIDNSTGALYSIFYDRRNTLGDSTEVYLSRSTDGGITFIDTRLSSIPFLPDTFTFLGDYIGITANRGLVVPVWTEENRDHTTSIWTSVVVDTALQSTVRTDVAAPSGISCYPSPASESFGLDAPANILHIRMYDVLGLAILDRNESGVGSPHTRIDTRSIPNGVYTMAVETISGTSRIKIVVRH
jgi:hypothetical protein